MGYIIAQFLTYPYMIESDSKGGQEVLFVALITGVVVLTATMAVSVSGMLTESTSEQIRQPEFESTTSESSIEVKYTGEQTFRGRVTSELYLEYDNRSGVEKTYEIYPEPEYNKLYSDPTNKSGYSVDTGDTVYITGEPNETKEIPYDTQVDVVWIRDGGGGSIVQQLYIPSPQVTGTAVRSSGEVSNASSSTSLNFTSEPSD